MGNDGVYFISKTFVNAARREDVGLNSHSIDADYEVFCYLFFSLINKD